MVANGSSPDHSRRVGRYVLDIDVETCNHLPLPHIFDVRLKAANKNRKRVFRRSLCDG